MLLNFMCFFSSSDSKFWFASWIHHFDPTLVFWSCASIQRFGLTFWFRVSFRHFNSSHRFCFSRFMWFLIKMILGHSFLLMNNLNLFLIQVTLVIYQVVSGSWVSGITGSIAYNCSSLTWKPVKKSFFIAY